MRKLFLFLMAVIACAWNVSAQTRTVHGTVLDAANNEPLIGATIMPVGGGQGAAADIDGNFTLTIPANVKKATISYVGYKSQTVDIKNDMKVYLAASSTTLDDVVVVAYGTATKESLTGSVAVVGTKDIEDRPVTSATAALEGNVTGVQVNSTVGMPGQDPSIRIRGFNSVNGSNDPIYVVDGMPYSGSIADINPADIESMSVLKDAASAALYGNKGANGVVLITTKRAKKAGKVEVTLNVRQGIYTRGIPEYDRLNANQWMETMFQGAVNGWLSDGNVNTREDAIAYMQQNFLTASNARNNIYGVPDNELFDSNGKLIPKNYLPGYTDLEWWNAVKQTGHRQEYGINATAASENYNLFASIGYLKEHGYVLATDFERFTGRVNANFNPVSYFKFGVNLNASVQESEVNTAESTASYTNPFQTMMMAPIYPYYAHNADGSIMYEDGEPVWNTASYLSNRNVGYEIRHNKGNYQQNIIDGTLYGTAIIPYGFELTLKGNMYRVKYEDLDYSNKVIGDAAPDGSLTRQWMDARYHTFMQTLNWSHEYGLHHIDVLLDHENYSFKQDMSVVNNRNQTFDGIYSLINFPLNVGTSSGIVEERTESYLARARYNFNQKYFGEVSVRRDGSSRFAKDSRWGTFWSIGGSWVISKEKFMHQIDWINYLKLRAAYGSVGNNASAGAYASYAIYGMNKYSNLSYLYRAQLAANDIRWESTKTFDIALEGTLFDNRLNFSVGYFDKRNADLLFDVILPISAGSNIWRGSNSTVLNNIGTMSNRGWEISFSGDIIRNKDLLWTASIDATFINNKIVSLPQGDDIITGIRCYSEGHSIYEFYTYKWAGVDQLTGESLYVLNPDHKDFWTTDAQGNRVYNESKWNQRLEDARQDGRLREINGKYYVTESSYATREWSGSALPTVYGSIGTNLSWKNFNFGLLFTYSLGGKVYDSIYSDLMVASSAQRALHKDILNSWTGAPEGMTETSLDRIDPNGTPEFNFSTGLDNNGASTRWLKSASYLVLKNVMVSYNLPQKWVRPLKLQNINLGVSIDNLFTVTSRKGINPQQSYSGGQDLTFNTPRVFSFQVTAKF